MKTVASLRVSTAQQDVRSQRLAILELGVSRTTLDSFMSTQRLKPSP